jgi:hypothetical protein
MNIRGEVLFGVLATAIACVTAPAAAEKASCAKDIDAMQARLDARLDAIAGSGRTAPQSLKADMSAQPTPSSIAKAEEKLGELDQHMVRNVRRALTRARAAEARGNTRLCERQLAAARRALGP